MSYGELERRSDVLCRTLAARPETDESIVGLGSIGR